MTKYIFINIIISGCFFILVCSSSYSQELIPSEGLQNKEAVVNKMINSISPDQEISIEDTPDTPVLGEDFFALEGDENSKDVLEKDVLTGKEDPVLDYIDFRSEDIQEVVNKIEDKSGLVIVIDEDIQGQVSLSLDNILVTEALKIILDDLHLAFVEEEGLIRVMPYEAFKTVMGFDFGKDVMSRIVRLSYIDKFDIFPRLENSKSPSGRIIDCSDDMTFVLWDTPERVTEMENMIKEYDAPLEIKEFSISYLPKEVLLKDVGLFLTKDLGTVKYNKNAETLIVKDTAFKIEKIMKVIQKAYDELELTFQTRAIQVKLTEEHQKGIDWEAIVSEYKTLNVKNKKSDENSRQMSLGVISSEDYFTLLEALETVGEVKSFSPREFKIVNNQKMNLTFDHSIFQEGVLVSSSRTVREGEEVRNKELLFLDIGLHVSSIFQKVGKISLLLADQGELGNLESISSQEKKGAAGAFENTSEFALEKENVLVLGGVFEETSIQLMRKVPLLGDIPLLGSAFRHKNVIPQRTEYVIFIIPNLDF